MFGYGYTEPKAKDPYANPYAGAANYDPRMIEAYEKSDLQSRTPGAAPTGLTEIESLRRKATVSRALGAPSALEDTTAWLDRGRQLARADAMDQAKSQGQIEGGLPFGGTRAKGGPVMPGHAYLVGEEGPEVVVPQGPGMVLPNPTTTANAGMPPHPNDMPPQNPYESGGQFRDPTSGQQPPMQFGPQPASREVSGPGMPAGSADPASANSRSVPTIFDIGTQAGEQRGGPMSSAPTTWRAPAQFEEAWKGKTGSEKKALRGEMKFGMAKASMDEEIALDKQAKGAIGEWEASKAARESLGLPPLDDGMEKQFYNGNVQKQLAMTQQLRLINNEHLNQKASKEGYTRQQAEKQDERLWQTERTKEERAYDEKRKATQTTEQRAAAANWQPLKVAGRDTGYATNELGNLIQMGSGDPVEPSPQQLDAMIKDGWSVSKGPQGVRLSKSGEKDAKATPVRHTQDSTSGKWLNWFEDGTYEEAKPRGQAAAAPASGNISQAEYDKLKPGTTFVWNGKEVTKK